MCILQNIPSSQCEHLRPERSLGEGIKGKKRSYREALKEEAQKTASRGLRERRLQKIEAKLQFPMWQKLYSLFYQC